MRRLTTKFIFLAGVLAHGWLIVRADQIAPNLANPLPKASSIKRSEGNAEPLLHKIPLPNKIKLREIRPKAQSSQVTPASKNLRPSLSSLQANDNLFIPNESSELQITKIRPLTLEEVQELVEVNNATLKIFTSRVDQAKSLLLASISKWYPTLNLSASGLPEYFTIEQFRDSEFGQDSSGKQWRTSLSLQFRWNLIDPARVPEIGAARDTYEKAKNSYFITLRQLRLDAAKRYFLLQRADEGVRIGKESIRASIISLRDSKARYKAGVATRLEVLEAETQLARDKQLLTSKLGDQDINRRLLAGLLNLPSNITPTAASPAQVIGLWKASLQESIAAAFSYREELDQYLLDISINNSNANAALAASQPKVSIVDTFTTSSFEGQTGIISPNSVNMNDNGSSVSNSIGLSATWSIFDGGRAKALYRFNKEKSKESEANFASQRSDIRREVEESFFNLRTSNRDIETTTREVIAAREALRLARLRFQAGVTNQREVVNNQRDLTQAEVRYSDAITKYNISLAELRRRTGIDHIKACQPIDNTGKKENVEELLDLKMDQFPTIPACEESSIRKIE